MTSPADEGRPPEKLTVPLADVERELAGQIARGHGYRAFRPVTSEELQALLQKFSAWNDYSVQVLRRSFTGSEVVGAYLATGEAPAERPSELHEKVAIVHRVLRERTDFLAQLQRRLHLYDVAADSVEITTAATSSQPNPTVFVVHGHDHGAELRVLRFLERAGDIRAVVLHEQPNRGQTIIEKFEDHASDATFAIVLLTADDEGAPRGGTPRPRPRQNVVFELGFFYGKLGRARVAALCDPEIERPSDINGVIYIELDQHRGWQFALAREMKSAGLPIDLNLVV